MKEDIKSAVCSNADEEYIEEVLDKLNLHEKIDRVRPIIPGKGKVESLARFLQDENPEFAIISRRPDVMTLKQRRQIVFCLLPVNMDVGTEEELKGRLFYK